MDELEDLVIPEEGHDIEGLAAAVVEKGQDVEGLAAAVVEKGQDVEGLAAAVVEKGQGVEGLAAAVVEKGQTKPVAGFAGAKRGRFKGFCGKPGTAAIAPRGVRFVGNLENASDAALPIAAPRLAGFAMISPMVLGLSFVVLMV